MYGLKVIRGNNRVRSNLHYVGSIKIVVSQNNMCNKQYKCKD